MSITAPVAPPRGKSRTSRAATPSPASPNAVRRAEGIDGLLQIGAAACMMRGWHADAGAIAVHGEKFALEIAKIGDTQEKFGDLLDKLTNLGPYAGLITVAVPFAAQILANHNIIPVPLAMAGVVPPAMLEAQIKASMATQAANAVIAQHEAELALDEANQKLKSAGLAQEES